MTLLNGDFLVSERDWRALLLVSPIRSKEDNAGADMRTRTSDHPDIPCIGWVLCLEDPGSVSYALMVRSQVSASVRLEEWLYLTMCMVLIDSL
jgi:hypothetical protein